MKAGAWGRVSLCVPGEHNIINAIAAAAVALYAGTPFPAIAEALPCV